MMPNKDESMKGAQPPEASQAQQCLTLMFNVFSTLTIITANKACFARVTFNFPTMLSALHYAVTWIGLDLMRRWKFFDAMGQRPSLLEPQYCLMMVAMAAVTPLNNMSLKLNSIGSYHMFKLLAIPFVVLLEYCLDRSKTLSSRRAAALVLVCIGAVYSSHADLSFSRDGSLVAAVWLPLSAIYKVQWSRTLARYNCTTPQMLYSLLPRAMLLQLLLCPLVDPAGFWEFKWTVEATCWILLSAFAAFFVNLSGFLVLADINALAHILLGQLKSCSSIMISYWMFDTSYNQQQLFGATIAAFGVCYYTYATTSDQTRRQKVAAD